MEEMGGLWGGEVDDRTPPFFPTPHFFFLSPPMLLRRPAPPRATSLRRPATPRALRTMASLPPSVTPAALATALASPAPPVLLDASWFMPATGRDGKAEFAAGPRLRGSFFYDFNAIADTSSGLPHMLPSEAAFACAAAAVGVTSPAAPVAVYDRAGIFSAPRVWWTWRAMGHDK